MRPVRPLLIGVAATLVLGSVVGGAVVAGGLAQSPPQDARPASDPIGDILRNTPVEGPPVAAPAPKAATPVPTPQVEIVGTLPPADGETEVAAVEETPLPPPPAVEKIQEPEKPVRRQRRRVAIVEAIDKVTAERMRFEVPVGGRPVRFNGALIFTARACEVSAPGELVEDAIAYLDVSLQPRGTAAATEPRQIFRGWMFASTPGVSGLQHPIYDAWVVGCKA